MADDFVIGVDSSTQSTKAIAWTRDGQIAAEGRGVVPLDQPQPGYAQQSAADWWESTIQALREVLQAIPAERVAGLAISNQRETVAILGENDQELHPAIVWLDERGREEVSALEEKLGAGVMHKLTGKPVDGTPAVYRLHWFRRHQPQVLDQAVRIADVHGYLISKLTGTFVTSWTCGDPFGLMDIENKVWSKPILRAVGLKESQLARLMSPGTLAGTTTDDAADKTGLCTGTPVYIAGGDGQCAGLGVNAVGSGEVYVNLGTALITGAWSESYVTSSYWRTLVSPTGEGYFLEGVLRAGTFLVDWFAENFAGGRDVGTFAELEKQAAGIAVGSEGVTVCPYLSGCMDPHWDPYARASFSGLATHHRLGHLYRAVLEGLSLESVRCLQAMAKQGFDPRGITVVGGGSTNKLWLKMLADASGLTVRVGTSPEISSLGAAVTAAVGVGWHDSFSAATAAMCHASHSQEPDPSARPAWDALSALQAQSYRPGQ
ncbi:MAG: FGGY-family carbohydrate kinase [Pseudomonadota bacterium]